MLCRGASPVDNGSQSIEVVKTLSELKEAGVNASLQAMRAQMYKFADRHPEGDSIDVLKPFARWFRNGGINPPDESSVNGVFGKLLGKNADLITPGFRFGRVVKPAQAILKVPGKVQSRINIAWG